MILVGRRIRLRSIEDFDIPELYRLTSSSAVSDRWRFRGATPGLEEFAATLFHNTLSQFVVEDARGRLIGHVTAYEPDFRNRHAAFAVMTAEEVWGTGVGMEASALFLFHLFETWDLRKVYCEVIEHNMPFFASALRRYGSCEGILKAHEFSRGTYRDVYLLGLWREPIEASRPRWERYFARGTLNRQPSGTNASGTPL